MVQKRIVCNKHCEFWTKIGFDSMHKHSGNKKTYYLSDIQIHLFFGECCVLDNREKNHVYANVKMWDRVKMLL